MKAVVQCKQILAYNSKGETLDLQLTTEEKIIEAAIQLVKELGYKGATTRKIAEAAGLNEVTLFRHFGNKKGLIQAIIDKFSYVDFITNTLEKEIVWDVHKDLRMMATLYQTQLEQKRDVILISIKEAGAFPELDRLISHVPIQYKKLLADYFQQMVENGKIRKTDPVAAATNFFFLNFGYMLLKTRIQDNGEVMALEDFLNGNIALFANSLV